MEIDIFVKFPFSGSSYIVENDDKDKDIIKNIKNIKILSAYGNEYIVTKISNACIYAYYDESKKEYNNLTMFNKSVKQLENSEVVIISMEEFINE